MSMEERHYRVLGKCKDSGEEVAWKTISTNEELVRAEAEQLGIEIEHVMDEGAVQIHQARARFTTESSQDYLGLKYLSSIFIFLGMALIVAGIITSALGFMSIARTEGTVLLVGVCLLGGSFSSLLTGYAGHALRDTAIRVKSIEKRMRP